MAATKTVGVIDIREILAMVWRRKWLVIIPAPLVAALTFASSYLLTPKYGCSTIIAIDPQVQLIADLQRMLSEPASYTAMQSRDRSNVLNSIYNELTSSHYAELLAERMKMPRQAYIDERAATYVQMQGSLTMERARLMVLQDMLKESVELGWASGDQIRIMVLSPHPVEARDLANHLGDIFIAEKMRQDLMDIRSSQDFSDVQLEKYERQVSDKVAEITRVEQRLARLRSADATTSESNRSEIEDEINQTESEIDDLRAQERTVLGRLRGIDGVNVNQLSLTETDAAREARDELGSRLKEIGDLLSRYTWNNPQVINFKLRQNHLLETIERENRAQVNAQYAQHQQSVRDDLVALFNARSTLDYLYSKKPYLESTLSDLAPSTDLIPEYEAQLAQLQRELQVATDIRDRFRRQQESSTISQALLEDRSSSKYRKVEPAKLPMKPMSPNRTKIMAMGILLGLVIGGGAVLVAELMDSSFKKVQDVEEVLGLRVIGISPKIDFR
ncbi:MAG: Wzz/FepE/Etk N-terminal domain-containing protein [Candidatus Zixiibacteriota bacterium]